MKQIRDPLKELKSFHRDALKQLEMLEKALAAFRETGRVDEMRLSLEGFYFFVRKEMALHSKDEEEILFPLLENMDLGGIDVKDIVDEHEYLRASEEVLELLKGADRETKKQIESTVDEVIQTLREHIRKEDVFIIGGAARKLSREQLAGIAGKMNELRSGGNYGY